MIFGWKKNETQSRVKSDEAELFQKLRFFSNEDPTNGIIRFNSVTLPPAISQLNIQIDPGSWLLLYGDDDFAKALFCDLCFSYIFPEKGEVKPLLKGSDVSFLGRSNTTYGKTLVDQLSCGVKDNSKDLMEFVSTNVLSKRFHRHLSKNNPLSFLENKKATEIELDERDFLEIAEANLLLQKRKSAVIDTTTDFYQIAMEQGFKHSEFFLNSGKTLIWIIDDKSLTRESSFPWKNPLYAEMKIMSLYFQSGSRADHIN